MKKKTCIVRPDWLLVRSKLVNGLTNDLLTDKKYLQGCVKYITNVNISIYGIRSTHSELHDIYKCVIIVRQSLDNFILDAVNWLKCNTLNKQGQEHQNSNFKKTDESKILNGNKNIASKGQSSAVMQIF